MTKVLDFTTGADVAKAEQEGEVPLLHARQRTGGAGIIEAFSKDFPKIKGKYVRAQNGALFSKVLAERSAGKYTVDVIQFSEPATALDFQKRGGYMRYVSPQSEFYAPEHLSNPVGDYFWVGVTLRRHCLQHRQGEAGGRAEDLEGHAESALDERHERQAVDLGHAVRRSGTNCAGSTATGSGRSSPSCGRAASIRRAQLFDRLAKGDDKICVLAEYAGYLLVKEKGAPVAFVAPADGLPAAPLLNGVVDKAPHPEAAKLFVDWLMSLRGQTHYQNNPYPLLRLGAQGRAADAGRHPAARLQAAGRRRDMGAVHGQPRRLQQGMERDARVCRPWHVHRLQHAPAPPAGPRVSPVQMVAMATVVAVVAVFVLYPIYYLLQAALDVGAPDVRPPTAYGFDNFAGAVGLSGRSC